MVSRRWEPDRRPVRHLPRLGEAAPRLAKRAGAGYRQQNGSLMKSRWSGWQSLLPRALHAEDKPRRRYDLDNRLCRLRNAVHLLTPATLPYAAFWNSRSPSAAWSYGGLSTRAGFACRTGGPPDGVSVDSGRSGGAGYDRGIPDTGGSVNYDPSSAESGGLSTPVASHGGRRSDPDRHARIPASPRSARGPRLSPREGRWLTQGQPSDRR